MSLFLIVFTFGCLFFIDFFKKSFIGRFLKKRPQVAISLRFIQWHFDIGSSKVKVRKMIGFLIVQSSFRIGNFLQNWQSNMSFDPCYRLERFLLIHSKQKQGEFYKLVINLLNDWYNTKNTTQNQRLCEFKLYKLKFKFLILPLNLNTKQKMNSGRKIKKNPLITVTPSKQYNSKPQFKLTPSAHKKQKLIDYRDYLMSLRNIDLGSLIQKNSQKDKKNSCKLLKKKMPKDQFFISKAISPPKDYQKNLRMKAQKAQPQIDISSNQNIQKPTELTKKVETTPKAPQKVNILGYQNPEITQGFKNKMKELTKRKRPQVFINQGIEDTDLFCDQTMDDLMNRDKMTTPKLIHIGGFREEISRRSSSLKHSSKNREINMPSIEQRDPSQQSQECQQLKQKKSPKFACESYERRKYNSCDHQKYSFQHSNQTFILTQRTPEIEQYSVLTQIKQRINDQKPLQQQKLHSTVDTNAYSSTRSKKYLNHQNVETTPFSVKFDLKHEVKHDKDKQNKLNDEKSTKKMSLNVAEIVKRINSRQSKSSMSDRSSHSNRQKTRKISEYQDFLHESNEPLKNAKITVEIHNPGINFGRSTVKMQEERKRLSLKMQVKQFREKNLSIMRLYE